MTGLGKALENGAAVSQQIADMTVAAIDHRAMNTTIARCFSALEEFEILRSMTVREYRDLQALGLDPLSPEAQAYRKIERIK